MFTKLKDLNCEQTKKYYKFKTPMVTKLKKSNDGIQKKKKNSNSKENVNEEKN